MSKTYTTIQGDMWDLIAYKVYGSETQMKALLRANKQYRDVAVFPSGIVLTCPGAETPKNRFAPPWKE